MAEKWWVRTTAVKRTANRLISSQFPQLMGNWRSTAGKFRGHSRASWRNTKRYVQSQGKPFEINFRQMPNPTKRIDLLYFQAKSKEKPPIPRKLTESHRFFWTKPNAHYRSRAEHRASPFNLYFAATENIRLSSDICCSICRELIQLLCLRLNNFSLKTRFANCEGTIYSAQQCRFSQISFFSVERLLPKSGWAPYSAIH